jgi:hypothetical protein
MQTCMRSTTALIVFALAAPAYASEPCEPAIGAFELIAPRAGETGVPRNVSVSARSGAGTIGFGTAVAVVPDGAFVFFDTVTSTSIPARAIVTGGRSGSYIELRPGVVLAAHRRYELRRSDQSMVLSFTTGADEDLEPPPAPSISRVEGTDVVATGGCEQPAVEIEIGAQGQGGARTLFGFQRNSLPINDAFVADLGAGPAPLTQFIVGEADAQVDGEVVAIDLAGNRSPPTAFSTETPPRGCKCVSTARSPGWAIVLVLGLVVARRRRCGA